MSLLELYNSLQEEKGKLDVLLKKQKKSKLQKEINISSGKIQSLQKEITTACDHPILYREYGSKYHGGGYDYRSRNDYFYICQCCLEKVIYKTNYGSFE